MPDTFLIDTSVYLNILGIPERCDQRTIVLANFERYVNEGASLLLPMGTIWETGRWIGHLKGGDNAYRFAKKFVEDVQQALKGDAPYNTTYMPEPEEFQEWVRNFPESAKAGLSLPDHSIVQEYHKLRKKTAHKEPPIYIWSLDGIEETKHLAAYGKAESRKHP